MKKIIIIALLLMSVINIFALNAIPKDTVNITTKVKPHITITGQNAGIVSSWTKAYRKPNSASISTAKVTSLDPGDLSVVYYYVDAVITVKSNTNAQIMSCFNINGSVVPLEFYDQSVSNSDLRNPIKKISGMVAVLETGGYPIFDNDLPPDAPDIETLPLAINFTHPDKNSSKTYTINNKYYKQNGKNFTVNYRIYLKFSQNDWYKLPAIKNQSIGNFEIIVSAK